MQPKEILVHLDGHPNCEARIELALALAQQGGGRAAALYGLELPKEPVTSSLTFADVLYGVHDPARQVYERERDAAYDGASQFEAAFMGAARRAGVAARWEICPDKPKELIDHITARARYADLVILGQADPSRPARDGMARLPEAVMLAGGRPVLIVPYGAHARPFGKHVLVAWNETREAARAVADAHWALAAAEKVTVLSVGEDADGDAPARKLARLLEDCDIHAEAVQADPREAGIGELILSRATAHECDLVVMGGYGHSPTRELFLGGATREVLQQMTVPVMMSH